MRSIPFWMTILRLGGHNGPLIAHWAATVSISNPMAGMTAGRVRVLVSRTLEIETVTMMD